jgi:ABC-type enterochelin transport system permease subunit
VLGVFVLSFEDVVKDVLVKPLELVVRFIQSVVGKFAFLVEFAKLLRFFLQLRKLTVDVTQGC